MVGCVALQALGAAYSTARTVHSVCCLAELCPSAMYQRVSSAFAIVAVCMMVISCDDTVHTMISAKRFHRVAVCLVSWTDSSSVHVLCRFRRGVPRLPRGRC